MTTPNVERILQNPDAICALAEAWRGLSVAEVVILHQSITRDVALWAHEMRQRDPVHTCSFEEWRDEGK